MITVIYRVIFPSFFSHFLSSFLLSVLCLFTYLSFFLGSSLLSILFFCMSLLPFSYFLLPFLTVVLYFLSSSVSPSFIDLFPPYMDPTLLHYFTFTACPNTCIKSEPLRSSADVSVSNFSSSLQQVLCWCHVSMWVSVMWIRQQRGFYL